MVAHCAGMVDLVALPVWVGTLIANYNLDPRQAGGLPTLFLLGAVASSLLFAIVFLGATPKLIAMNGGATLFRVFAGVMLAGALVAALAYTAAFTLLGLVTRRALVWGIGYLLIFESFIARGGRSIGALSIHAHAASVLARAASVKVRLAYFSEPTGIVAALAFGVVALALTSWRLRHAEVP